QGTVSATGPNPLGLGSVNMNGGTLRLNGGQSIPNVPLSVSGVNQDVVWAKAEASPNTAPTAALHAPGQRLYEAGVTLAPSGHRPPVGHVAAVPEPCQYQHDVRSAVI